MDCVYSYLSVLETSKKMTLPSFFTKRLHVEKVIKFTKNRLYNCFSCLLAAYLYLQNCINKKIKMDKKMLVVVQNRKF